MLWTGQVISKGLRAVTKNVTERDVHKNAVKKTGKEPNLRTMPHRARTHPSPASAPL